MTGTFILKSNQNTDHLSPIINILSGHMLSLHHIGKIDVVMHEWMCRSKNKCRNGCMNEWMNELIN